MEKDWQSIIKMKKMGKQIEKTPDEKGEITLKDLLKHREMITNRWKKLGLLEGLDGNYSAIPMLEEFHNKYMELKDSNFPFVGQDLEEFIITQMTKEFYKTKSSKKDIKQFIRYIYRIGRTVGCMTKLNINKKNS